MMKSRFLGAAMAFGLSLVGWSQSANALVIDWVDWTSTGINTVNGTLASGSVAVTYTGPFMGATQTGTGTNYWFEGNPKPYTNNAIIDNAPTAAEQIGLNIAGQKIIVFSQAVLNPVFAFNSWNGNNQSLTFANGIVSTVLSTGRGYWGQGTVSDTGTGFASTGGEPHGVLQLTGSFTSITFTDTQNEFWHGFTMGIEGLAPPPSTAVPEPGTLALFGLGLLGLGFARRRKTA